MTVRWVLHLLIQNSREPLFSSARLPARKRPVSAVYQLSWQTVFVCAWKEAVPNGKLESLRCDLSVSNEDRVAFPDIPVLR